MFSNKNLAEEENKQIIIDAETCEKVAFTNFVVLSMRSDLISGQRDDRSYTYILIAYMYKT